HQLAERLMRERPISAEPFPFLARPHRPIRTINANSNSYFAFVSSDSIRWAMRLASAFARAIMIAPTKMDVRMNTHNVPTGTSRFVLCRWTARRADAVGASEEALPI